MLVLNENEVEVERKVVETFDRTKNLREIKLVYSTLAESFKGGKIQPTKEAKGSSSKAVASTKPKLNVDVWSGNHPYYTGSKTLMDTEGRVDRFMKKYNLDN